jgi:hypothetical protein
VQLTWADSGAEARNERERSRKRDKVFILVIPFYLVVSSTALILLRRLTMS